MHKNHPPLRAIRSFARCEGRMTPRQKQAFAGLWPRYRIDLSQGFQPESFFTHQKLIVEIGFGMGHSLLNMAEQFPEYGFLGIEVYRPGIGHVLSTIAAKNLNNIRLISENAVDVCVHLPDRLVDAVLIFFPDPWPKKRHHKRRLIQPNFIELLLQKLKVGGYLHIATDWSHYAGHIERVLEEFTQLKVCSGDLQTVILQRSLTKFEKRGVQLGHEVMEFVRFLTAY